LVFDDLPELTFPVILRTAAEPQRLTNGNFLQSYVLDGAYAIGQEEVYTTSATDLNVFRLPVVYYSGTTQVGLEYYTIRANQFGENGTTLAALGIEVDKYRPENYDEGQPSNLGEGLLTYELLHSIGTLNIVYSPTRYNVSVEFYMNDGAGYSLLRTEMQSFTQVDLDQAASIGQIIDVASNRPQGYKATIRYYDELTVSDILA